MKFKRYFNQRFSSMCIDMIYRNCHIFGHIGHYYVHPMDSLDIFGPFDMLIVAKKAAYEATKNC